MGPTKLRNSAPLVEQLVARLSALKASGRLLVAYSGGLDSTVLLHALRGVPGVRAVHINHGMQAQADAWASHCARQCEHWRVPLDIRMVQPDLRRDGPEAGARAARYAAFSALMGEKDVLLTAHHANDQAETFLLQALRGAGVRGLAAMPEIAPLGAGRIARPLLDFSRKQLLQYARAHALDWVEDSSNVDTRLARSYLRVSVSPQLAQHWPGFESQLVRAAAWCAQASELQDDLARMDIQTSRGPLPECLCRRVLTSLSGPRQDNLVRYWLRDLGLAAPDHRHLAQIRYAVNHAGSDAQPLVEWADVQLRAFQEWIFVMPALAEPPEEYVATWDMREPLCLPAGCGVLQASRPVGDRRVTVRLRQGGERLALARRAHSSSLKKILQAAQVPPWVRARLPLVYMGEELVAVADYWKNARGPDLQWLDAPPGAGLVRVVASSAFR